MGVDKLRTTVIGNNIELEREQWRGEKARISNYPGLVDEVCKYTWTLSSNGHPYLRCQKLKMSLHKFVLCYIYGKERVEVILSHDNIIEHLDNDGLNCTYDNLHIISSDFNKAKAFTIDKMEPAYQGVPHFVTGVFFSHINHYYQMQVFFNDNVYFDYRDSKKPIPVEEFFFLYSDFENLYIDWLYVLSCREGGLFDIRKMHAGSVLAKNRPLIEISEEERDHVIIERNGEIYLNLSTSGDRLAVLSKASYKNLEFPIISQPQSEEK